MERAALKSSRTQVTKLINNGKDKLKTDKQNIDELIVIRDRIKNANEALERANENIVSVLKEEEFEKEFDKILEYQDQVIELISRLQNEIDNASKVQAKDLSKEEPLSKEGKSNVKLHKLELRKFRGELSDWTLFWEQFRTAVHENESLDVVAKFNYLEQSLKGKAALTISGLTPSEKSYNDAIDLLKHEYGNEQRIIDNHIQKLLTLTPVKNKIDAIGLRNLYNATSSITRSLTSLGVNEMEYGMMVKSVIINSMPYAMKTEYYKKHPSDPNNQKNIVDQINILLAYLKLEVESLEIAMPTNSNNVEMSQHFKKKVLVKNEFKNKNKDYSASALLTTIDECLFCKGKDHITAKCDKSDITVQQKRDILKENKRCFRCTKPSHNSRFCRSRVNCDNCKYRHETTMCDPNYVKEKQRTIETTSLFTKNHESVNQVYLQTAKGYVSKTNDSDQSAFIRLVIDGGSQLTYVKYDLSRNLGFKILGTRKLSVMPFGSEQRETPKLYNIVELKLTSQYDNDSILINAIEVPQICYDSFKTPNVNHELISTLKMADISIGNVKTENGIALLIGADNYWRLATGEFIRLSQSLTALNTKLGWTLQGPNIEDSSNVNTTIVSSLHVQVSEENDLDLKKFWELETIGINDKETQKDFTNEFIKNKIKMKENRYEVSLPWKVECQLDNNFNNAYARMKNLTFKLSKDSRLIKYDNAVRELIDNGIAEKVSNNRESVNTYYMPHKPVYREDKSTTQIRVVFDASDHAQNLPSLNHLLHAGENMIIDLLNILLNFRVGKIGITADIEKAFLQIKLNVRDRDCHRFLWYKYPINDMTKLPPMQEYRMTRVTFGVTSSPFILNATLKKLLYESTQFTDTAKRLLNKFYVDDLFITENSLGNAVKLYNESKQILKTAGMNLRKWHTNDPEFKNYIEHIESGNNASLYPKVLGIYWDTSNDNLYLDLKSIISFLEINESCTKRKVSSAIGRIYDPLGFLGPFTIKAKILLQSIWKTKLDWDIELPMEFNVIWKKWCCELKKFEDYTIPRNIASNINSKFELHIFSDASQTAYGAVAYVREILENNQVNINLLIAKNRVAPLKGNETIDLSLPKLELTAALCASRLKEYVIKNINIKFESVNLWTDSKITLFWINGDAAKWKPYVHNRVQEIQKLSQDSIWRHCIGKLNPADLLTRGESASDLIKNEHWLNGPKFLTSVNDEWTINNSFSAFLNEETLCALNASEGKIINVSEPIFSLNNYERLEKCLRVTAYIMRIFRKNTNKNKSLKLSVDELLEAENYWIKNEQHVFQQEIDDLSKNGTVDKKSTIYKLTPFLDNNGLLRIKSRLQEAELTYETANPIILPKNSIFAEKLIWKIHNQYFHSGINLTLAEIRKTFWLIRARQKIKSLISKCVVCKKLRGKPGQQSFAPLPKERILKSNPFETTGVDFAGPLYVLNENNDKRKSYLMILTCAVTRAIHLELVLDLTTESCLRGLRRFIARRGVPTTFYSDNAKTFKRTSIELNKLHEIITKEEFQKFSLNQRINWKFIIERAAWWGGFWERMVKTVKDCLKFALGKSLVNIEELRTILTEIEATVNSRPLTYIDDDKDNLSILSPSKFLLGDGRRCNLPNPNVNLKREVILQKWNERQRILQKFWKKWSVDYLQQLRTAHRNIWQSSKTFKVGDVVLLHDQSSRLNWKMVRVKQVYPGRDGNIRACEIELANKTLLRRPIQLLYPLELPLVPRENVENNREKSKESTTSEEAQEQQ